MKKRAVEQEQVVERAVSSGVVDAMTSKSKSSIFANQRQQTVLPLPSDSKSGNSAVQSLTQSNQPLIRGNTKWRYAVSSSDESMFEKQWEGRKGNGKVDFFTGVPSEDDINVSLDNIRKGESGVICIFITF